MKTSISIKYASIEENLSPLEGQMTSSQSRVMIQQSVRTNLHITILSDLTRTRRESAEKGNNWANIMQRLPAIQSSCDLDEEYSKNNRRSDSLKFYKDWECVGAETLKTLDCIESIELDGEAEKKVKEKSSEKV